MAILTLNHRFSSSNTDEATRIRDLRNINGCGERDLMGRGCLLTISTSACATHPRRPLRRPNGTMLRKNALKSREFDSLSRYCYDFSKEASLELASSVLLLLLNLWV